MAVAIASIALLLVPAVGSVYPVPAQPVNIFPHTFLAYVAIGLIWIFALHRPIAGFCNQYEAARRR
ncbi:MAG TPA: hypothetical protein VGI47_10555 [Candidatus Binataceae bacterium]